MATQSVLVAICIIQSALEAGHGEGLAGDRALAGEQQEYVDDVAAYTGENPAQVLIKMHHGKQAIADEWRLWENKGPMTPKRITEFYKQTSNYIYDLGEWHLFDTAKRRKDLALIAQVRPDEHRILDFGGGVGLNAIPLARVGFDVTLADVDGVTLDFAAFRAARHGVKLKIWRSDTDAPPMQAYDLILLIDVVEHLSTEDLRRVVTSLRGLKHPRTRVLFTAPFGRTEAHPMHFDGDPERQRLIADLQGVQLE